MNTSERRPLLRRRILLYRRGGVSLKRRPIVEDSEIGSPVSDETAASEPSTSFDSFDAVCWILSRAPWILVAAHVVSWACGIAVIWFHRDLSRPGFATTVENAELFLSRVNWFLFENAYSQVEWLSYYWTTRQELEMNPGSGSWWYFAWVLLVAGAAGWYALAIAIEIVGKKLFPKFGVPLLLLACGWILRAWLLWLMRV